MHKCRCVLTFLPLFLYPFPTQILRSWAVAAGGIYVGGFLCLWLPEVLLCPTGSHVPVVSLPWTRHLNLHALFHLTSSVTCLSCGIMVAYCTLSDTRTVITLWTGWTVRLFGDDHIPSVPCIATKASFRVASTTPSVVASDAGAVSPLR